jgi:hypothetical protein
VVGLREEHSHELQRKNNSLPLRHFGIFRGTVAYGLEMPFFPQLAAPNLAPKTYYVELVAGELIISPRFSQL